MDWDEKKIALARCAAEGLDASFETLDVRASMVDSADTVLLVDVLHYLDARAQDQLIEAAAERVRPGGRLILRDATSRGGWRSFVTLVVEWVSRAIRFNVGERILIRDIAGEIVPLLEAKNMDCRVQPCWRGTPFSNVLLVATRPHDSNALT
jgi:SAM-dependent methyltransferase